MFTARYELNLCITQIRFVFKGSIFDTSLRAFAKLITKSELINLRGWNGSYACSSVDVCSRASTLHQLSLTVN
jgi:hypothetical protein